MNDLDKLKKYINCDWFLRHDIDIKHYYNVNTKAYRWFHSKAGFMHMSISFDSKLHADGELYQPNTVESYIADNTKNILELGCGQGANLTYLALRHTDIQFTGIDLRPSINKQLSNVKLIKGDYHYLDKIPDNSQDIVYAFETLCYSLDKDKIFKEVNRVLRKNGVFIIFDGYANKERKLLSDNENEIMALVEKGMAVKEFEYVENISKYANHYKFKKLLVRDLSENVMPNMNRFKRMVTKCMKYGWLFKFTCIVLPKAFVGNAISGYLMATATEQKLFCYFEHVYRK